LLKHDLAPEQRGLRLKTSMPVYAFPSDYLVRLLEALAEVNLNFRRACKSRQTQQGADQ
jgi:hypothetical protein